MLDVNCPCGSGKKFADCHGGATPQKIVEASTPPVVQAPELLRLDLGCGQTPKPGFEGVDIWHGAKHVVDLFVFPWPFADNSVGEIFCSHFIEHIPQCNVDLELGNTVMPANSTKGKNLFFRFFEECYRILVPGGIMTVHWPALRHNRAFWDPTHTRYIPEESVAWYLNAEWRAQNNLDHYNTDVDLLGSVGHAYDVELGTRAPEVVRQKLMHEWNHAVDFIGTLTARKPRWKPPQKQA